MRACVHFGPASGRQSQPPVARWRGLLCVRVCAWVYCALAYISLIVGCVSSSPRARPSPRLPLVAAEGCPHARGCRVAACQRSRSWCWCFLAAQRRRTGRSRDVPHHAHTLTYSTYICASPNSPRPSLRLTFPPPPLLAPSPPPFTDSHPSGPPPPPHLPHGGDGGHAQKVGNGLIVGRRHPRPPQAKREGGLAV